MRFTDRREDVFGVHPVPEIRIDEARLDQAVASDDERRRKGQKPAVIALELVEIDTECLIRATNAVAGLIDSDRVLRSPPFHRFGRFPPRDQRHVGIPGLPFSIGAGKNDVLPLLAGPMMPKISFL